MNQAREAFEHMVLRHSHLLSGREKHIIIERINGTTLKEIGKRYGVTDIRIRQIEGKAMRKLETEFCRKRWIEEDKTKYIKDFINFAQERGYMKTKQEIDEENAKLRKVLNIIRELLTDKNY